MKNEMKMNKIMKIMIMWNNERKKNNDSNEY